MKPQDSRDFVLITVMIWICESEHMFTLARRQKTESDSWAVFQRLHYCWSVYLTTNHNSGIFNGTVPEETTMWALYYRNVIYKAKQDWKTLLQQASNDVQMPAFGPGLRLRSFETIVWEPFCGPEWQGTWEWDIKPLSKHSWAFHLDLSYM